jgi:hypothetical protein
MTERPIKTCPRCGTTFECKASSPDRCDCASVELHEDTRHTIAEHYVDCLCVACLRAMEAGASPTGRGRE